MAIRLPHSQDTRAMKIGIAAVLASTALGGAQVAAQNADPLRCLPPTGQGLYEIAASNLAMRYRDEPTAENKQAMCNRFRSTIVVYEKAVDACGRSDCKETKFLESCARAKTKAAHWRKRTDEECR